MATFTGTNAAETITPQTVSPTVVAGPVGSKPGSGADIIDAGGGNDQVAGGGGADSVLLGAGNDVFTWRTGDGDDTLEGGADFDTAIFKGNDGADQIDIGAENGRVEIARIGGGGGSVSMSGVEQIAVTPSVSSDTITIGDLRGTGVLRVEIDLGSIDVPGPDTADDTVELRGSSGADTLKVTMANGEAVVTGLGATVSIRNQSGGGDVRDRLTLKGAAGDDTLDLSALPADTGFQLSALGEEGNDTLLGGAGTEKLVGGGGEDLIAGGLGADTLIGDFLSEDGEPIDIGLDTASYAGSNGAVSVNLMTGLGQGGHAEGDTLSGIENLVGSAFADSLTGDAKANLLDGRAGADRMAAGGGDDTYVVDNAADIVVESAGGGTDTVIASLSHALVANVERLVLSGTADIDALGNALANELTGNDGDNRIDGSAGADRMAGSGGNDRYVVENVGDVVIEAVGKGNDTVFTGTDFALPANVENLVLLNGGPAARAKAGAPGTAGFGNGLDNRIEGNGADNVIAGSAGNDRLLGRGGGDRFLFDTTLDRKANIDHIADFVRGKDRILLDATIFAGLQSGKLDRDAFAKAKKGKVLEGDDRLGYDSKSGALFHDADGRGGEKAVKFAVLDGSPDTLSARDFLIVP